MFLVNISVPVIYAGMAAKRGIMTTHIAACRVAACVLAALSASAAVSPAAAGVWVWGCQGKLGGKLGEQQVAYNRYYLVVVPAKTDLGKLRDIIDRDSIVQGGDDPASTYEAAGGDAFNPVMNFKNHDNPDRTVVLTEKSSKKISSKTRLICGRDESTDIYRKVYRYQREGEPVQDITMQCIEFQLSTRGGRPCN